MHATDDTARGRPMGPTPRAIGLAIVICGILMVLPATSLVWRLGPVAAGLIGPLGVVAGFVLPAVLAYAVLRLAIRHALADVDRDRARRIPSAPPPPPMAGAARRPTSR